MSKYRSLSQFELFISKNGKRTSKVIPGSFYTYDYSYNSSIVGKSQKVKDQISYYDRKPLIFVFNYYRAKNGEIFAEGLNFHQMPVKARIYLLSVFKKISPSNTEKDLRINISPNTLKTMIKRMQIKSKFVFRQYNINRIQRPMQISFSDMKELIKYTPETYNSRQYDEVVLNYRLYNPYNVKKKGRTWT